MVSKKLDSILSNFPSATVNEDEINKEKIDTININKKVGKNERIVAVIPYSLKQEIRQYLVNHPGDTEKTVILRGLKALGFNVQHQELEDKRGKRVL
jgi:hypothetical protein